MPGYTFVYHILPATIPLKKRFALFPVVIAALASACSSDRAYAPPGTVLTDVQVSRDVAVSAGEAIANDVGGIGADAAIAGLSASLQPSNSSSATSPLPAATPACSYEATSGRWTCAPHSENGITTKRSYAYFDGSGRPMKTLDALATASANFQMVMDGTVLRDSTFTGVVHRTRNHTLSGLLGAETSRRWDGTGTSADTNTHRSAGSVRKYAGRSADTLIAVVYAQPRPPGAFPLSGTMIRATNYTVTSTGATNETRTVSRRAVTTYNGTSTAVLTVGGVTCTLHLDTHLVTGCS